MTISSAVSHKKRVISRDLYHSHHSSVYVQSEVQFITIHHDKSKLNISNVTSTIT